MLSSRALAGCCEVVEKADARLLPFWTVKRCRGLDVDEFGKAGQESSKVQLHVLAVACCGWTAWRNGLDDIEGGVLNCYPPNVALYTPHIMQTMSA